MARGSDNCQMPLYRGTRVTATNVDNLSMAAYSAATARMTVQHGALPIAVQRTLLPTSLPYFYWDAAIAAASGHWNVSSSGEATRSFSRSNFMMRLAA